MPGLEGPTGPLPLGFMRLYEVLNIMYIQILNSPDDDPTKQTTMDVNTLTSWTANKKRPGRPTHDWTLETAKMFWTRNQTALPQHLKGQDLDLANDDHRQAIKEAARKHTEKTGKPNKNTPCLNSYQQNYARRSNAQSPSNQPAQEPTVEEYWH